MADSTNYFISAKKKWLLLLCAIRVAAWMSGCSSHGGHPQGSYCQWDTAFSCEETTCDDGLYCNNETSTCVAPEPSGPKTPIGDSDAQTNCELDNSFCAAPSVAYSCLAGDPPSDLGCVLEHPDEYCCAPPGTCFPAPDDPSAAPAVDCLTTANAYFCVGSAIPDLIDTTCTATVGGSFVGAPTSAFCCEPSLDAGGADDAGDGANDDADVGSDN